MQYLAEGEKRIINATGASLQSRVRGVEALSLSLARYPREYRELPARLDDAAAKLGTAVSAWIRWREREPGLRQGELKAASQGLLARIEGRMKLAASRLEALSPLAVLARGYAIATRSGEGRPLTDSMEVKKGEMMDVRLHRGKLYCEVRGRESADEESD
jgi:exonuclease VII large subunit